MASSETSFGGGLRGSSILSEKVSLLQSPGWVCISRATAPFARGGVIDVDLFLADVLLDDLLILHGLLADPQLLLDHGALFGHDLFLDHRHRDLVVADLGPGALLVHRHPLDGDLLVSGGHPHLLAVGAHPLADVHGPSLALTSPSSKLFLTSLYPQLVLVLEVVTRLVDTLLLAPVATELTSLGVAHPQAGTHLAGALVGLIAIVLAVGAPCAVRLRPLQPVVGVDPLLVIGGYVLVVIEGGAVLGRGLVHRYLDAAIVLVGPGYLPGDEGGTHAQEAHLHADVLRLVVLV